MQGVATIVITIGALIDMDLKICKIGDCLGSILPQEAVNRGRAMATVFLIESTEGADQLTPCQPAFEKKRAKSEEIIGRYRNTLYSRRANKGLRPAQPRQPTWIDESPCCSWPPVQP